MWKNNPTHDGNFRQPTGVDVDGNGYIYAVDIELGDVQVFDQDGEFIMKRGGRDQDSGVGGEQCGIDGDRSGCVYIVDKASNQVLVYQMK